MGLAILSSVVLLEVLNVHFRDKIDVPCKEVVPFLECLVSEVPLYMQLPKERLI